MKLPNNWPTWLLCAVAFLLPWQTRYIFGYETIAGSVVQFGTSSVYAVELMLVPALVLLSWKQRAIVAALAIFSVHLGFAALLCFALMNMRVDHRKMMLAFCAGLIAPVVFGLWQVVTGGSGASTLLGLASRDAERLGDAVVMVDGTRVLRAYGSFPHPNIFGGFLAIGTLLALQLRELGRRRFLLAGLLGFGLVLTASRSAILGFVIAALAWSIIRIRPRLTKMITGVGMTIAMVLLLLSMALPGLIAMTRGGGVTEVRSLTERQAQYIEYPDVVSVFGVGYDRYIFALHDAHSDREWWEYQPVHNAVLLMIAEAGIFGALLFVLVVRVLYRRPSITLSVLSITLFAIALFDHYLWSQWSGLALVAFAAAVAWREHPQPA